MNFASDTAAPAHPKIIEAVMDANQGATPSYGADPWTQKARQALSGLFETDLAVTFVNSGTASNALALSLLCPPDGAILCHTNAHINCDERGAPEFYTHGGKIMPLEGEHDKISEQNLRDALDAINRDFVHETPANALSLSQLSEAGTAYPCAQIAAYCELAHAAGLHTHMDGARFANALVSSGASPAQMSWKSGIDVLSFGFTKNGAMGAEAVILFGDMARRFNHLEARRKRGGHMPPKQRFVSAQVLAMLQGDLWLQLAQNANAAARALAQVFEGAGANLLHLVDGNEVFVRLSAAQAQALRVAGAQFNTWSDGSSRFVCSWNTNAADIDGVMAALR